QTGAAWEFSVPVSVAGGLGGVAASLGAIHSGPFPVEDILTGLQQPAPGLNCLGFKDLLDEYKDRGPIKGQKICARPLEEIPNAPPLVLPAFRHAFAYDPLTGNNYAIRTLKCGNAITTSCAGKVDHSGSPDDPNASDCRPCVPGPGRTEADVSRCFAAVHAGYPEPSLYQNMPDPADSMNWGPNSNSYAAAMATCCDQFSPAGMGILPGWNHRPAGPCPLVCPPSTPPVPGIGPVPPGVLALPKIFLDPGKFPESADHAKD